MVAAALAGCAIQSPPPVDEIRRQAIPNVQVPAGYTAGGAAAGAIADDWLSTFGDMRLDQLVREALDYNSDLRVAAARVDQSAGFARLAGATIYPAVNVLAHGGGKSGGDGSGLNTFGLFVNWELDVWGRVRQAQEAGRQQFVSTIADAEYARQSLAAMVAKSWILAVEARLQLANAREIVAFSEQAVGLARDRLRVGRGDEYDVAIAEATLQTARDAARQVALAYEQALRALEALAGRYPAASVEVASALPAMAGPVPIGLPSELLERRPDVIAAERRVAAAFARVEEAKAARLPKIALTASVNSVTSDLFVLQERNNPVLSVGANLMAPIFNGWALQSQVEIRTAEQKLAVAEYGRVASRAFSEVEGALSAGFAADEREPILARAVDTNARALELARIRFRVGSGDLRAVTQQSVALYGARTALLRVQSERRIQRVNLHLALGGSFDPRRAIQTSDLGPVTIAAATQRNASGR